MSRLDRERLDRAAFPTRLRIEPRFSDLDRIDHINNVAIADLLQEGRFRFSFDNGMAGGPGRHLVVAATITEYADDLLYGSPVEVCTGVLAVGRTSFRLAQVIRQDGRTAVYAEAAQVVRGDAGPMPVPDDWRAKLDRLTLA
ncbi:MAG TPA: hotdog domain-containing protein [Novosphingobium sp.]|nr:hotdog domain-containing protein [Novosphingobium sp.]